MVSVIRGISGTSGFGGFEYIEPNNKYCLFSLSYSICSHLLKYSSPFSSGSFAKTLTENDLTVDLLPMQDVEDLTAYRAVIAGSAIQAQQWLPEAMQFLQTHRAALVQKPFATFTKINRTSKLASTRITLAAVCLSGAVVTGFLSLSSGNQRCHSLLNESNLITPAFLNQHCQYFTVLHFLLAME